MPVEYLRALPPDRLHRLLGHRNGRLRAGRRETALLARARVAAVFVAREGHAVPDEVEELGDRIDRLDIGEVAVRHPAVAQLLRHLDGRIGLLPFHSHTIVVRLRGRGIARCAAESMRGDDNVVVPQFAEVLGRVQRGDACADNEGFDRMNSERVLPDCACGSFHCVSLTERRYRSRAKLPRAGHSMPEAVYTVKVRRFAPLWRTLGTPILAKSGCRPEGPRAPDFAQGTGCSRWPPSFAVLTV